MDLLGAPFSPLYSLEQIGDAPDADDASVLKRWTLTDLGEQLQGSVISDGDKLLITIFTQHGLDCNEVLGTSLSKLIDDALGLHLNRNGNLEEEGIQEAHAIVRALDVEMKRLRSIWGL